MLQNKNNIQNWRNKTATKNYKFKRLNVFSLKSVFGVFQI